MLRYAIIFLIISLIAGALGMANLSVLTRRISMILFAIFFIGFLALLAFALLVGEAITHSSLTLPMLAGLDAFVSTDA